MAEGFRREVSIDEIWNLSKIDRFFLEKIQNIVSMENKLMKEALSPQLLSKAKAMQFPDRLIADLTGESEKDIKALRETNNILPAYKAVNTCPSENGAALPYFYSSFEGDEAAHVEEKPSVII